jgi:predicted 3-demethylubiquinone-9 3-methyltransferase (glyoxalase superfamily)
MQKITPFLWFEDKCEEAINFYVSVFNSSSHKQGSAGIVSIMKYPENSSEPHLQNMSGKVLTAVFELEGQRFMALDGGPNVFPKSGPVSFYVECADQSEVDHFWNALTAGGNPAAQQCGWLQDKYGFSWQIIPKQLPQYLGGADKVGAARATHAMMQMKKIVISDLEAAYTG